MHRLPAEAEHLRDRRPADVDIKEADPEPAFSTPSLLALIPILGILIYYLGFRDDIWEDMGGKAEL